MTLLKRMYDNELVKKVNATDTSKLVSKIYHNAKIKYIEHKVPSILT